MQGSRSSKTITTTSVIFLSHAFSDKTKQEPNSEEPHCCNVSLKCMLQAQHPPPGPPGVPSHPGPIALPPPPHLHGSGGEQPGSCTHHLFVNLNFGLCTLSPSKLVSLVLQARHQTCKHRRHLCVCLLHRYHLTSFLNYCPLAFFNRYSTFLRIACKSCRASFVSHHSCLV